MENKKLNITLSAIKVFQEKGVEHATVSDIVKGAGIAQGTFYLYFPSKLAVMPSIAEVMVEEILEKFNSNVDLTKDFHKQLHQFIEMIFDLTEEYRDIFALIYAGMASSDYLDSWEEIYENYYIAVAKLLKNAQDNQVIRQSIDPKQYAVLLIGLIESAADQSYLYDKQNNLAIEAKKKDVFDFALAALR